MAVSAATRAFVLELFDGLGGLTARAMMGGLTLYCDGQVFALVTGDERIYLKAAGRSPGSSPPKAPSSSPTPKDGATARMGYWSLPDAALDDPEAACDWARRVATPRRPRAFPEPRPPLLPGGRSEQRREPPMARRKLVAGNWKMHLPASSVAHGRGAPSSLPPPATC